MEKETFHVDVSIRSPERGTFTATISTTLEVGADEQGGAWSAYGQDNQIGHRRLLRVTGPTREDAIAAWITKAITKAPETDT